MQMSPSLKEETRGKDDILGLSLLKILQGENPVYLLPLPLPQKQKILLLTWLKSHGGQLSPWDENHVPFHILA